MTRRIIYDGLNLALEHGMGIATYTRMLTRIAHELGHEIGIVYSSPYALSKTPLLREIAFFDDTRDFRRPAYRAIFELIADQLRCHLPVRPARVDLSGIVIGDQFAAKLGTCNEIFLSRNLFANAQLHYSYTKRFINLIFDRAPDILHCTYPMPIRARAACSVYTIHDIVPLRLPFATRDHKRRMYRLLKSVAARADHIVTVSENSRRDIIEILGVEGNRVTNTYQAVAFPEHLVNRTDEAIAEQLEGSFGLSFKNYLLFHGALEPKKNVSRLIEAYLLSGVDIPLVLVTGGGWRNKAEQRLLAEREKQRERDGNRAGLKRVIHRFQYMTVAMLVTLIRGARACVFPSLYEGFGLPVLEAMLLGTPVVTSRAASLPEVAGDAALLVNPYDIDEIGGAIKTITNDADLRTELSRRGRAQAETFSVARYRERMKRLYDAVG